MYSVDSNLKCLQEMCTSFRGSLLKNVTDTEVVYLKFEVNANGIYKPCKHVFTKCVRTESCSSAYVLCTLSHC